MKKIVLLMCVLLLTGCVSNNLESNSNSQSLESTNSNSENEFVPFSYKTRSIEYDFSYVTRYLSSSYNDYTLKVEEKSYFADDKISEDNYALISFDNISKQSTIPNYPIINAYNKNNSSKKYVTLLSSSTFDIHEIDLSLSLWSEGDLSNVPNDYYFGIEYLKNDNWIALDSFDIEDASIGKEDGSLFVNIKENGVRDIRIAFDFTSATNNVRFALYSLVLAGEQYVVNKNTNIEQISFKEDELTIKQNESFKLDPIVTSRDVNKFIEFQSSDRSVAIVDENGTIKGLSVGDTFITAKNGDIKESIKVSVISSNDDYKKTIQNPVSFIGEIPEGFKSNFESYFNGTQLNFKAQGNYVLTPTYHNISGATVVVLNMMLSTSSDIDLSKENIFTVEGLDSNGDVIEKVQKTNLINTSLEDVEFEFNSSDIVKYRLVFEYKHTVDYGSYIKTGKNYCLNSLFIYQK